MNCNTTHYRANSSSVPGDPTAFVLQSAQSAVPIALPAALITAAVLGDARGLACAAAWGLLSDCLSGGPLGIDVLGYTLSAAIALHVSGSSAVRLTVLTSLLTGLEIASAGAARTLIGGGSIRPEVVALAAGSAALLALPTSTLLAFAAWKGGWLTQPSDSLPTVEVQNRWSMLTG